jgi:hypothetical protein
MIFSVAARHEENQKLRRQNARLTEDLRKAHIMMDVQIRVAAPSVHPDSAAGPGGVLMAAVTKLATGIIQKRNGDQVGNSSFSNSLARAHDAEHVHSAWGIPGGKLVPEGSYL